MASRGIGKHACAERSLISAFRASRSCVLWLWSWDAALGTFSRSSFGFGEGSLGPRHILLLPLGLLLQTLYLIPAFLGFVGLRRESSVSVAGLACGIGNYSPPASYCCLAA